MSRKLCTRRVAIPAVAAVLMVVTASGIFDGRTAAADSDGLKQRGGATSRVVEEREVIPFETITKHTAELRVGTSRTTRPGVPGVAVVTYRVVQDASGEVRREELSRKVIKEPVAEVVEVGKAQTASSRGRLASRGYFSGRRVLTMIATGYDPSPASNGGYTRTSTGLRIGHGVVAVDPRVIPLGTRLYIEGYGYAVAADVGSAIKGNRIDLGHDTSRGARNIGRRVVKVHILD